MSTNAALFDFMIGAWEVEFLRLPDTATVGRRALVTVSRFLDDTAVLDEWRHVDEAGNVNFRGATFRTYVADKDIWYMLWMTPSFEGFSELYGRGVGDEVHTSGKGNDTGGTFEERGRYHEISQRGFAFALERAYDGAAFAPFVALRAKRRTL